jgi:hypothetical protein
VPTIQLPCAEDHLPGFVRTARRISLEGNVDVLLLIIQRRAASATARFSLSLEKRGRQHVPRWAHIFHIFGRSRMPDVGIWTAQFVGRVVNPPAVRVLMHAACGDDCLYFAGTGFLAALHFS